MKVEIILSNELGDVDILYKTLKSEDYDKFMRELGEELRREGENRKIEQVIIHEANAKLSVKIERKEPSPNQFLTPQEFSNIKHIKK
jgi:hypothetical protein